ncbi:unnamed protein product [Moneuplotes crassus]|uniref:EamA domain-containing protein n=1 Tax=Euplotes crassus TaxID=5936 RepID=A0AAD2CZN3_EUPCR|nr:unnamed protein product [Moneuplotes crassus]
MSSILEESLVYQSKDRIKEHFESFSIEENQESKEEKKNTLFGILLMVISGVAIGAMSFCIKLTYQHCEGIKAFDIFLIRSLMLAPFCYFHAKILKVNLIEISNKSASLLVLRCIFGFCGNIALFVSINYVPVSVSLMIFNVNPVFVTILAYFFLKEQLTVTKCFCCVGAFVGIVILGLGRTSHDSGKDIQGKGIIMCVMSAIFGSLAYTTLRKINTEIHYLYSPYYLSIFGCVLCTLLYLFFDGLINPSLYTAKAMIFCIICGGFSIVFQVLISMAYRHCNASTASPITYMNVIFNLFTDTLYFHYEFYWTDLIGGILTTGCVVFPVLMLIIKQSQTKN